MAAAKIQRRSKESFQRQCRTSLSRSLPLPLRPPTPTLSLSLSFLSLSLSLLLSPSSVPTLFQAACQGPRARTGLLPYQRRSEEEGEIEIPRTGPVPTTSTPMLAVSATAGNPVPVAGRRCLPSPSRGLRCAGASAALAVQAFTRRSQGPITRAAG